METILPILKSVGTVDLETNFVGRHGILYGGFSSLYALESLKLNDALRKEIVEIAPFIDERQLVTKLFSGNYQIIFISVAVEYGQGIIYRNRKNGIRLRWNSINLTDETNWDKLISGELESKFNYTREILQRFKDNYDYDCDVTVEGIVENLKKICAQIPSSTLIVFLLGSEFDYDSFKITNKKNFNAAIEKEFANYENVKLINYTKFLHSKNDYDRSLNNSNHFARRIYFEIAADMVKVANEFLKNRGSNKTLEVRPKTGLQTLIWSTEDFKDDIYKFYQKIEIRGFINVVGYAIFESGHVIFYEDIGGRVIAPPSFQMVIVATGNNFFEHSQMLQRFNVPKNMIVDGRVFQMPNLDFQKFLIERVAYGSVAENEFSDESRTIYRRVCSVGENISVDLGKKSFVGKMIFKSDNNGGKISVGNFSSIADNVTIEFGLGNTDYNVSVYDFDDGNDWNLQSNNPNMCCKVIIGSDVKINSDAILISNDIDSPLVIGDGAIVEENSVVTESVPPYAVVSGNPAQIINYRFPQEIIDALQKIKWWNWDFDKIKKYFPYFTNIKKFISAYNAGG